MNTPLHSRHEGKQAAGDAGREEKCALLKQVLLRMMPAPGDYSIGIDGLTLFRREAPKTAQDKGHAMPHVTLVFQGAESVFCNRCEFICSPCQLRVIRRNVFGTGCVTAASADLPFIAVSLRLDSALLQAMNQTLRQRSAPLPEVGGCTPHAPDHSGPRSAVAVRTADAELLDAFLRLIQLHEKPARIPVLARLIIQEIHYLLALAIFHEHCGKSIY